MRSFKPLILASAFATFSCFAQASSSTATVTLTPDGGHVGDGFQLSGLQGTATLTVSERMLAYLSVMHASLQSVPEAVVTTQTVPKSNGTGVRLSSVVVESPLSSLSAAFEGGSLTARGVEGLGGVLISTIKTGATNGAGWVSIGDLQVDLVTKTIRADIAGGNGLVALNDHALWRYESAAGPLTFTPSGSAGQDGAVTLSSAITLSGLRWLDLADVTNVFAVALNLNTVGKAMLRSINTPNQAPDGFGSITLSMSVSAVPEPGTFGLVGVGLAGLALFGRRRDAGR